MKEMKNVKRLLGARATSRDKYYWMVISLYSLQQNLDNICKCRYIC